MQVIRLAFIFILTILYFKVHASNISTEMDALKLEYGCVPQQNWELIEYRNKIVKNVCLEKGYEAHNEPRTSNYFYPILFRFENTRLIQLDQIMRTFTIIFRVMLAWEDPHIKTNFEESANLIRLPPVTTEMPAKIWTPFAFWEIEYLTRRRYNLDPVIAKHVFLHSGSTSNEFMSVDLFPPNATVVLTELEWIITTHCNFTFSKFPFDKHICRFGMKLGNMNVTIDDYARQYPDYPEYMSDGFHIKETVFVDDQPQILPAFNYYAFGFGFDIEIKRQFHKYFFQYYLPCITIVVASSFSFIIPLTAIPGRISLVVTLLLTLTNIFMYQMVRTIHMTNTYIKLFNKLSNQGLSYLLSFHIANVINVLSHTCRPIVHLGLS